MAGMLQAVIEFQRQLVKERLSDTLAEVMWPAAGWVDTEIGCFHLSEVHNAKKEVQPRVEA